jgi:replication factor A1
MEGNYDNLVEFIAQNSGLSVDEIIRKIEAKQAKLSGLISKEGAAQVIAAELNISFDKQMVKIAGLVPGMRKINIIGKIIKLEPVREFNKNGRSGRIGSFTLADDSSNIRTVLWDENHIALIDKKELVDDDTVEIGNASIRNGELHLGSFSEIKKSEKNMGDVVFDKPIISKKIKDFNQGESVSTRAFIVQMFEPKFFNVCPECRRKVSDAGECNNHGKVVSEKRSLLSFVVDDGSESVRSTMFSDVLEKVMSKEEIEDQELFAKKKEEMMGKELIVSGNVRRNQMFDSNDFVVSEMKDVNIDELIEELEK